jgi:hypothetical protein
MTQVNDEARAERQPPIIRAADQMATAILRMTDLHHIDPRSAAADAMLSYAGIRCNVYGDEINAFRKLMGAAAEPVEPIAAPAGAHLPGCAYDHNKPHESTGSCMPDCPIGGAETRYRIFQANCLHDLKTLGGARWQCGKCLRCGTMVDGVMNWDARGPAAPAGAAEAGDVRKVVEALTFIANLQKNLDGSSAEEAALTAESEAKRVLAAARRLLDAETGVGERLATAIRKHRDQRGDDRCWRDDEELYAALPEGHTPPARDSSVELENCRRYIASRQNPATVYTSPERTIEVMRNALEYIAHFDRAALDGAATLHYNMNGVARKALEAAALAAPAPATPATARATACETCAKLPKTRDGVPIVPGMKVWSGKSATLHTVRSVCEGTFVAVCDCHGKELVCVSNDVQAYDEESRPVEFPFDHTVFSTRAAAEAAAASASPGGVATGEGGR